MVTKFFLSALAIAGAMRAEDKPVTPGSGPEEIRVFNELVPAGGTVQIKYSLTNPQPILSGGTGAHTYGDLDGVALWDPKGDAAGIAILRNGNVYVSAISPSGNIGMADDPFLTITMNLPTSLVNGTSLPLTLSASGFTTSDGPLPIVVNSGTLKIGGNFSIHGVTPGGGTYPAGTVVRIDGQGFLPNAQVHTKGLKISSPKVVSSTEIDFTLQGKTTLDGAEIEVQNGPFTQTYYSYLRGVYLRPPSRTILQNSEPVFQQLTHALATAGPFVNQTSNQYVALALQNPNPGPAVATLTITHSDGSTTITAITLLSGVRVMDELAALCNLNTLRNGDRLSLTSTAAIQILGIMVDENAGTMAPFLPTF
jgi:hypothetical protein